MPRRVKWMPLDPVILDRFCVRRQRFLQSGELTQANYLIECRRCAAAWTYPAEQQIQPGGVLTLLEHVRQHRGGNDA